MSTTMTRAEREAFLAGTHVGILSVADGDRGPLAVPIWYRYEPGDAVRIVTGGASRKAARLRAAGRATLCVQSEAPPYRYVTVEGPVEVVKADVDAAVREMAHRYLGPRAGARYLEMTAAERGGEVLVRLVPERWLSADYGKVCPIE